jgi:hypothetical protein
MTDEEKKLILELKQEVEKIKVNLILENKKLDQIVSVVNFIIQKENINAQ